MVCRQVELFEHFRQIAEIFDCARSRQTCARVDSDRIAQVLSNLNGNAIQYGTRGPIDVVVHETEHNPVAIEVHNFGP